MANNDEARGSGGKAFWELSQEMEEQPHLYEDAAFPTDPETTDGTAEDDPTDATTDGATEDATTCGRSYGTIINYCYRVDSKIGPRACRQSRTRTSDKNSFASSRNLRKSSIKMSFVPGQFYLRNQPSNSDIDTMLQMQADNDRYFMTPTIDGGFIHAPVP